MTGWTGTGIAGVQQRRLTVHADERGSFQEAWRESWMTSIGGSMRQANVSVSRPGVLRGLHVHLRQADLWVVLDGHPFIALVDVRPGGRTGRPSVQTIAGQPGDALSIPAGVAHGFYARDAVTLLYLVTREFDGSDELGFAWDDPDAAVPWPAGQPVLSPRDASAPPLAQVLDRLGGQPQG